MLIKMNKKDIEYAKKNLKNTDLHRAYNRYSKEARRENDIKKYGVHVTDPALVSYFGRVLGWPIDDYRYEKIIPFDKIDEVRSWKEGENRFIKLNNYLLVVKNQAVVTIFTPPYKKKHLLSNN
jgi:hypothetical protein